MRLLCLLACCLFASAASAVEIQIDSRIRNNDRGGDGELVSAPRLILPDGTNATIRVGDVELAVTPRLQKGGRIELASSLTTRVGSKNPHKMILPKAVAKPGHKVALYHGFYTVELTARVVRK